MEEIEGSAPSVEEAIEVALAELGATEQEVTVQILQEPREGFGGVGSQEAVVRVRLRARREETSEEDLEEQAEIGAEFLEGLLARIGFMAQVQPRVDEGTMYLDVVAGESEGDDEDVGLLIGRHGQTLEAVQELTRVVVSHRTGLRCRVIVDIEDYKKRQRARLVSKAVEIARRVARTGREEALDPMNAYERKVVHDAVAGVSGVESSSRGEDPDRRVVIRPRS
ncbi:MAG TPA: RNA-binding cell elongation regulator Jag/EloR [Actinomycetota bacterium]|nr:RNA-binding cell elongation regulator Jag/EloR [Actinomycetota bacterium]